MNSEELRERSFVFAIGAFHFSRPLLHTPDTRHIGQQLIRCSSSAAANYRAACLARSKKEWLAKIGVVREESDESLFWLEFIARAGVIPADSNDVNALTSEARALTKIFTAAYDTAKRRAARQRRQRRNPPRNDQMTNDQMTDDQMTNGR